MTERLLFDTHAHYDDAAFDADREALLSRLPADGVQYAVNVGCDLASSRRAVELAQQYPYLYAGVGIHPGNAEECTPEALAELRRLAAQPKVVAIGEIGLDYHYDTPQRDVQRAAFRAQMRLAEELGLPFSLLDLKVYETKKKARYHQDVALTEEELAQPLEEHHYWLLEHGWEFAKPEEDSCGD